MKKLTILFLAIVSCVWILAFSVQAYYAEEIEIKTSENKAQELEGILIRDLGKIPYYWEKKYIEEIAWKVANEKEYELHVYDCTDFSKKLIKELNKKGFKSQCSAGQLLGADYPDHTWVSVFLDGKRIEVEATGGYIINEEEFKENYVKRWENLCW